MHPLKKISNKTCTLLLQDSIKQIWFCRCTDGRSLSCWLEERLIPPPFFPRFPVSPVSLSLKKNSSPHEHSRMAFSPPPTDPYSPSLITHTPLFGIQFCSHPPPFWMHNGEIISEPKSFCERSLKTFFVHVFEEKGRHSSRREITGGKKNKIMVLESDGIALHISAHPSPRIALLKHPSLLSYPCSGPFEWSRKFSSLSVMEKARERTIYSWHPTDNLIQIDWCEKIPLFSPYRPDKSHHFSLITWSHATRTCLLLQALAFFALFFGKFTEILTWFFIFLTGSTRDQKKSKKRWQWFSSRSTAMAD